MFQVERNAADNAKAYEKELINKGVRPGAARQRAEKARVKEIKAGNDWITKNVGLD